MQIFEADESIRDDLNAFYTEQGYHSDWSNIERAFVATDNNNIVGGVKVESSNGVSILRGMYISSNFQGNKLGTQLIKYIEPILNETISYCMPFAHLERFYAQIGFNKVNLNLYPGYLLQRYIGYENQGYKIIPMMRVIAT